MQSAKGLSDLALYGLRSSLSGRVGRSPVRGPSKFIRASRASWYVYVEKGFTELA